jgi:diacylglycerol O-acyltransferase / wax synthase
MRQLTSVDAQFLVAEDGKVHGHVTGLAIYDNTGRSRGPLTRDDVRDLIASRIHLVPPFRWRLVKVPFGLDLPYWVDDPDFDLDGHIHGHTLPAPGDDRTLAELVGEITAQPLDLAHPPWAVHVIDGLSGGRVAVATKYHHAAIDGMGGAELFAILHDPTPTGREMSAAALSPERVPGSAEMFVRGLAGIPRQPVRLLRSVPRALPHLDQVVTLRSLPGVARAASLARAAGRLGRNGDVVDDLRVAAPHTATSGLISGRRSVAFGSTSLDGVKAIKNRYGVTVNDVVMTIVAGGLRSWLAAQNDLPGKPLAAMVPVSVQAPEQPGGFGNRIVMMIPPIFSDEASPERRLQRTHEAMRSLKERHRAVPATLLQDANHFIPPVLLARAARVSALVGARYSREAGANLIVSNIPGARDVQYLAGARLVGHYPLSAIFHGMGLNITVVSYGDNLDWGIVCDPEQSGDAEPLMDAIRHAQAELRSVAAAKPKRAAAARLRA